MGLIERVTSNGKERLLITPRAINLASACYECLVPYYASRRSRTRDTVKLTVCVSVPAVTAQRLQCDEN